jgi:hypothetical protein
MCEPSRQCSKVGRGVARLKARAPIALGDCFAVTTAVAHNRPLLTGDPEIIDLADPPCQIEDLRPR